MKTSLVFVVGLPAFLIGAIFGIWFNQHRFYEKVGELNASHELEWAGQAFWDLDEWEHGNTNSVYSDMVYKMEYGVVDLAPFIKQHPHSEVATHYHEMLDNIVQYQAVLKYRARPQWYSGMTNWDTEFDAVLAKATKKSGN